MQSKYGILVCYLIFTGDGKISQVPKGNISLVISYVANSLITGLGGVVIYSRDSEVKS